MFPVMVWLALAGGALLLLAAGLGAAKGKGARARLAWHRRLAAAGLLLLAVHAIMGLSRFW